VNQRGSCMNAFIFNEYLMPSDFSVTQTHPTGSLQEFTGHYKVSVLFFM
jgi:hypothetical protein